MMMLRLRRCAAPDSGSSARRSWGVAVVCFALALLGAIFLIRSDKPWERGAEAREAKGLAPRVGDYAVSGLWYAGLANTVLLAVLGAAAPLWVAETGRDTGPSAPWPRTPAARLAWLLLVAGAAGAGLAERLPRMTHSLWNDESYSLRRYVWGCDRPAAGGGLADERLEFDPVSWRETLFFNRGANNHILFSVSAKICLSAWSAGTGASKGAFSEAVFRLPSLAAGLLGIPALALLGAVAGAPWAGAGAAWILALHPWHIRYAAEGRGYALLLLFLTLAMTALLLALRRDRLRWWAVFAVFQALYMLAFPGAVYDAAALAVAAAGLIFWRRGLRGGWRTLARLAAAQILSAMLFLQVYAPSIPQVRSYLERDIARGAMGWDWARDIWAHLAAGVQWTTPGASGSHLGVGLGDLASAQPAAFWFLAAGLPLVTLAGFVRAWFRRPELGALATTGLAAPALAFAHTSLTGNFLFSWYLIFSLPALCLVWICAFLPTEKALPSRSSCLAAVAGAVFVAAFFAATATPRRLIRDIPRQPMREAAAFVKGQTSQTAPAPLTAAVGTSAGQIAVYDPRAVVVDSADELDDLVAKAAAKGRDLYVYAAGMEKLRSVSPGITRRLNDSLMFEPAARLMGLEELFSYTIFHHKNANTPDGKGGAQ